MTSERLMSSRLISADSHVAVSLAAIRERVPASLHEAFDDAIAAQARIEAEVLYSEVSAFRAYGLVQGDWRPISRAFTDLLVEFAAHDPNRLAVSYQVPIIDIPYAVSEVE